MILSFSRQSQKFYHIKMIFKLFTLFFLFIAVQGRMRCFDDFFLKLNIKFLANGNERIVGGHPAALGQVPFIASLRAHSTTFHFAGAVIISNRWLLSVAHKLVGRANNSITIMLGIVSLTSSGTSRRSDTINIHPAFDFVTMANE